MTRGHAVIVGASMAGLLAARALAESFSRVTVLDRDALPAVAGHRRGVPHDRHVHGLQPRGLQLLEEMFSGLTAELVDAGAVQGRMRFHLSGHLLAAAGSRRGLFASRPLIEHRVRARVMGLPAVTIAAGRAVTGLLVNGEHVVGVRTGNGPVAADLVIDATGRGSRTPFWLGEPHRHRLRALGDSAVWIRRATGGSKHGLDPTQTLGCTGRSPGATVGRRAFSES
jgi:2-polyprenyl-6-methoxyphenol hydroxylase-like FAD-dependent oxidoreductase